MDSSKNFINFRDMGGLTLPDGRRIKKGVLFRTARLFPKSKEDKRFLESLGLECVVDLRTPEEIREKPDKLPKGTEYVNASVFGDTKFCILAPTRKAKFALLSCTDGQFDEIMQGIRDSYAYMPYAVQAYKELFDRLNGGKVLAFHCTAGKDRTGVAAMMIELALGRTREQAREQYMLSNSMRSGKTSRLMKIMSRLHFREKLLECVRYSSHTHDELFDIAYNAIFSKYATINDFLREEYGVTENDIENWKKRYTE